MSSLKHGRSGYLGHMVTAEDEEDEGLMKKNKEFNKSYNNTINEGD